MQQAHCVCRAVNGTQALVLTVCGGQAAEASGAAGGAGGEVRAVRGR